ncbi:galactosylceramide sulfotransferase-like [Diadema antillarum]|uniref:galactosylceramide sulfotransferase-like n=1 Tax=Diadema antillarum TaxID=105358 RepID=UPI003A8BBD83
MGRLKHHGKVCVVLASLILIAMVTKMKTSPKLLANRSPSAFSNEAQRDNSSLSRSCPVTNQNGPQRQLNRLRKHRIVFVKTHKTGSSTVASIFQRYGYFNGLNFLVPNCSHILAGHQPFSIAKLQNISTFEYRRGFDLLTNHVRYSRTELDRVMPNATYVTIIRDPAAQFESSFYYFGMYKYFPSGRDPIQSFLSHPNKKFRAMLNRSRSTTERRLMNQQLFDLGLELDDMQDDEAITSKIKQLDQEFDLVMISEFFDQSLLLLKKLLNLSFDDIRYFSKGVRSASYRASMSDEVRGKIRAWNSADAKLYEHFNRTFWRRVKEYGSLFSDDLAELKRRQVRLKETCFAGTRTSDLDGRVLIPVLRNGAPLWCHTFTRLDSQYTRIIRTAMKAKGVPLYNNCVPQHRHNHIQD